MNYRGTRNGYENLNKARFSGEGLYDIPILLAGDGISPSGHSSDLQFIGFNYAKTCKDPEDKCVHFFIDDYQFTRLWQNPDTYIPLLKRFKAVCTPDFSMYLDFPLAIQLYNHYRKHWLGAYWQMYGINVIPTIGWSDESSFEWCFDGDPVGGVVAVSSVGTQADDECKRLFRLGFDEMRKRLKPTKIYFYGLIPQDISDERIIRIPAFQEKYRKARI